MRNSSSTATGDWVAIFALGSMVPDDIEEIARKLEGEGIGAAVINARFAKPIDVKIVEFYAGTANVILTLEDHVLRGRVRQRRTRRTEQPRAQRPRGAHRLAGLFHRARKSGFAANEIRDHF